MFLFVTTFAVSAQDAAAQAEGSDNYFYTSALVDIIYPYTKGYVVQYHSLHGTLRRLYVPHEFMANSKSSGHTKCEVFQFGSGLRWPSIHVYYTVTDNGDGTVATTFSHARLFVRKEAWHESWGTIEQGTNLDRYFQNVTELKLRL
jgi:hypothetical protein